MRLLIFSTQLQANCYNHIYHIKEPARNDLRLVLCCVFYRIRYTAAGNSNRVEDMTTVLAMLPDFWEIRETK